MPVNFKTLLTLNSLIFFEFKSHKFDMIIILKIDCSWSFYQKFILSFRFQLYFPPNNVKYWKKKRNLMIYSWNVWTEKMLKKVKATIIGSGHLNILAYIQNNEAEAREKKTQKIVIWRRSRCRVIPSTIIMNVFHSL